MKHPQDEHDVRKSAIEDEMNERAEERASTTKHTPTSPPCECGEANASWHGERNGLRTYCCDKCWSPLPQLHLEPQNDNYFPAITIGGGKFDKHCQIIVNTFAGNADLPVFWKFAEQIVQRCNSHAELLAACKALLWPNVPSADDVAMLACAIGSRKSQEPVLAMVEKLRAAQEQAGAAIARAEGKSI